MGFPNFPTAKGAGYGNCSSAESPAFITSEEDSVIAQTHALRSQFGSFPPRRFLVEAIIFYGLTLVGRFGFLRISGESGS